METILLTGGIGDFLALESFFPDTMRKNLSKLYLASRANKEISHLFKKIYPDKELKILWEDFSKIDCVFYKHELEMLMPTLPENWEEIQDWSIMSKFPKNKEQERTIRRHTDKINLSPLEMLADVQSHLAEYLPKDTLQDYNGSSFIKNKLAELPKLPEKYCVIFPITTTPNAEVDRNFQMRDWIGCLDILYKHNMKGIVLGNFGKEIPINLPQIINLNQKTNIFESIEIMKHACGYIGVDSFLSVIAAKIDLDILQVKSISDHCKIYKEVYFAPRNNFDFMVENITLHSF